MDGGECGVVTCRLQCEISSVSVTGIIYGDSDDANGDMIFVRCHVPVGGGSAIRIDTTAVPMDDGGVGAAGVASWHAVALLSCDGTPACVRELVDRRSVVFEVRRRRRGAAAALRRRLRGSELVGRAEVAWRDVAGDDDAVERQIVLASPGGGGRVALPAPVLSVRMIVRVSETTAHTGGRIRVAAHRESGWSVGDEVVFGLAACAAEGALE